MYVEILFEKHKHQRSIANYVLDARAFQTNLRIVTSASRIKLPVPFTYIKIVPSVFCRTLLASSTLRFVLES
jgi:hypothetical protein